MQPFGRKRYGNTGARRRSLSLRLFEDKSGASAVEFAIVAPVFITMMLSLFEIGWFYYQTSILDTAAADAARLIETGSVQKSTATAAQKQQAVYDEVCDIVQHFGPCSTRLTVEVQTFTTFAALAAAAAVPPVCADSPAAAVAGIAFNPGSDQQIVRVRVCFLYKTVNPIIGNEIMARGLRFQESGSDRFRLVSDAIFCNEPYSTNGSATTTPNPCGT